MSTFNSFSLQCESLSLIGSGRSGSRASVRGAGWELGRLVGGGGD